MKFDKRVDEIFDELSSNEDAALFIMVATAIGLSLVVLVLGHPLAAVPLAAMLIALLAVRGELRSARKHADMDLKRYLTRMSVNEYSDDTLVFMEWLESMNVIKISDFRKKCGKALKDPHWFREIPLSGHKPHNWVLGAFYWDTMDSPSLNKLHDEWIKELRKEQRPVAFSRNKKDLEL